MRDNLMATLAASLMVLTTVATGCKSYADPVPVPDPGSMRVTVTSFGPRLDPDGYELVVGAQQPQHIGRDAQVSLTKLPPGDYNLLISGLDEGRHCRVPWNPRTIAVAAREEVKVIFSVYCGFPDNTGIDPNFGRLPPAPHVPLRTPGTR